MIADAAGTARGCGEDRMIDNEGVTCVPAPTCAECGREGQVLHRDLRDRLFGAPGTWSIRRCTDRRCGLGWIDPMPLATEVGKFYQTYYTHSGAEGDVAAPQQDGTEKRLLRVLARLMPWRSPQMRSGLCHLEDKAPGDLLEVGCGDGAFMLVAQRAGWRVHGIDFDESAIARARAKVGDGAVVGDLLSMGYPEASFDAIVLNNVIEHLPNPGAVMAECHRVLRPGGRVVMVTPNLDALGHRSFGADWRGLEVPRHLYLFSPTTLKRFAHDAGFAKIAAFSPIGNGGTDFMVASSTEIAQASGRTPPSVDAKRMRWLGRLGALFGVDRGEWVVLAAER
jgi:SAM-dependent methyltransferase